MVDVALKALDEDVPNDLYLSLRVGEQQKFTKASSTKDFKFAKSSVGARRYAKMEIYKRVGICSICIDTDKVEGAHEIAVPVDDARLADGELRYSVALNAATGEKAAEGRPPTKDMSAKAKEAREYMDRHQLEQRLSQAMQAALRERPEDPAAFVAERLMSGAGMMKPVAAGGGVQAQTPSAAEAGQAATKASPGEAAAAAEARAAPTQAAGRPAAPCPLGDPIMPVQLAVMPGFAGFVPVRGPGTMLIL